MEKERLAKEQARAEEKARKDAEREKLKLEKEKNKQSKMFSGADDEEYDDEVAKKPIEEP